jgi:malic enzyme
MRAILDKRIKKITMKLLLVTAMAIAKTVSNGELHYDNIIPHMYDKRIQKNIITAISKLRLK